MKKQPSSLPFAAIGTLLLIIACIAISQQADLRHLTSATVPQMVITTHSLQQCQDDLTYETNKRTQIESANNTCQMTLEEPNLRGDFTSQLWANLQDTKGGILASPTHPAEGEVYSLKPGETATTEFSCGGGGPGEKAMHWAGDVTLTSISKVPGDYLIYQATLKFGGKEYTVMVGNPDPSKNTHVLGLSTNDGPMRIDIIDITQDRVYLVNERNAC